MNAFPLAAVLFAECNSGFGQISLAIRPLFLRTSTLLSILYAALYFFINSSFQFLLMCFFIVYIIQINGQTFHLKVNRHGFHLSSFHLSFCSFYKSILFWSQTKNNGGQAVSSINTPSPKPGKRTQMYQVIFPLFH